VFVPARDTDPNGDEGYLLRVPSGFHGSWLPDSADR